MKENKKSEHHTAKSTPWEQCFLPFSDSLSARLVKDVFIVPCMGVGERRWGGLLYRFSQGPLLLPAGLNVDPCGVLPLSAFG